MVYPHACFFQPARGPADSVLDRKRIAVDARTTTAPRKCRQLRLWAVALAGGAVCGCAGWWDDVTSREFHFKDMFKKDPEPMWVLEHSTDGDKRAKALRALREPAQHGGSQQDQDKIVTLLVRTALDDPQAWCRRAAIESLRDFRDPRAVEGLRDAYYRADKFPADTATSLKCQVLAALGEAGKPRRKGDLGNPAAVNLLVSVLREPPVEGSEVDKQQKNEERCAAAKALGHFPQSQATEALVVALRNQQDVALRNNVAASLVEITGKNLPADPVAWEDFLHGKHDRRPEQRPSAEGPIRQVGGTSEVPR